MPRKTYRVETLRLWFRSRLKSGLVELCAGYVSNGRYRVCDERKILSASSVLREISFFTSVRMASDMNRLNWRVVSKTCTNEYPVVASVALPRASQN